MTPNQLEDGHRVGSGLMNRATGEKKVGGTNDSAHKDETRHGCCGGTACHGIVENRNVPW